MVNIKPRPGIMKIDLYEGGASQLEGQVEAVKLSSNENPYGPSPKAVDAYLKSGKALHRYPSTCLLYTSPSPRDRQKSRMPSSA